MNGYAKVEPTFWIGETGKALRKAGVEAQIVALYLLTNPHANPLGLYYCPVMFVAHETGLGMEGALKGLRRGFEGGFCSYDEASEMVWVYEMARYQIADSLKAGDNRTKWIQGEYDSLPGNPFLKPFFDKYAEAFHLSEMRGANGKKRSPFEGGTQAPSKPPSPSTATTTPPEDICAPESRFEEFWQTYPRKKGNKSKAEATWEKQGLGEIADRILADVLARTEIEWMEKQFIPYPTTYLNGKHWETDIEDNRNAKGARTGGNGGRATFDDKIRNLRDAAGEGRQEGEPGMGALGRDARGPILAGVR